jgi:ubiquinone/menaquinone biosynthesis C-methylase UbiE
VAVKRGTTQRRRRSEPLEERPKPAPISKPGATEDRREREADFFDEISERTAAHDHLEARPQAIESNFVAMLEWLGDLRDKRVLDVCCGTGTTSLLLAAAGAVEVVGCDVSRSSLDVARSRAESLDPERRPTFVCHDVETAREEWERRFDVVFGSYALHHLDLDRCLPLLASYLKPGGRSIFLETSARNPVLRLSRRWLTGRLGVPRYGTVDERPLTSDDLRAISCHLGGSRLLRSEYVFLRILDRQVFHYCWRTLSNACASADRVLSRLYPSGSYHVIVACGPTAAPEPAAASDGF